MTKKQIVRIVAIVLAVMMPLLSAALAFSASGESGIQGSFTTETKYANPSINELTGHGEEPEELSVTAGATYQEKAWYEYIVYSEHAVSSYRLDDDTRILFYDPYTYTNSMVMDVQFDATTTEFDTMSEYTISHASSKTISACTESTYTDTTATQGEVTNEYGSTVLNQGKTKTTYNYDEIHSTTGTVTTIPGEYNYIEKETHSWGLTESLATGSETKGSIGINPLTVGAEETVTVEGTVGSNQNWGSQWFVERGEDKIVYSDDYKTTVTHNYESTTESLDTEENPTSTTTGWETLAERVTKTIGSSASTSRSWSETESTTVTKTYAATHFASDGITPLPWAIVHYTVQMPTKCCLQIKYSGEWITISTVYCLLTTVQGTCRAWMENGQVYYEDWGSGEPVVATDFWSQFTTKERLIEAYNDKLFPVGGDN